jgi:hypothetical protein
LTGLRETVQFGVRTTAAWVAILILAGVGVFLWQRSQIVHLRAQVALQGDALDDIGRRLDGDGSGAASVSPAAAAWVRAASLRGTDDAGSVLRADERRLILDQYEDALAQLNLAPEAEARLKNLLADRVETVIDVENAAERVGFAEGSADTARAVALAVAEVDREIVGLVGLEGMGRIDGQPQVAPLPVLIPEPAAPPVVVTVVVQAPAPAPVYYPDTTAPATDAGAYAPYSQYAPYPFFYTVPAVVLERGRVNNRFAGLRTPAEGLRRVQGEGRGQVTYR